MTAAKIFQFKFTPSVDLKISCPHGKALHKAQATKTVKGGCLLIPRFLVEFSVILNLCVENYCIITAEFLRQMFKAFLCFRSSLFSVWSMGSAFWLNVRRNWRKARTSKSHHPLLSSGNEHLPSEYVQLGARLMRNPQAMPSAITTTTSGLTGNLVPINPPNKTALWFWWILSRAFKR